ncbi:MAG: methionyl-tRNA formyltransferase [Gammaproteobacteria bacterium]|nr:methionyl-tRNA formyltransferase [Gammaproteobacteria bacterium]
MRIVFAGTPEIAQTVLQALIESHHDIIAVYTQPDREAGRGRQIMASPVKQLALAHQIPIYQPLSLKDSQAQAELAKLKPDLMIVVAYGLILPQAVLDIPSKGCWNIHVSLLPRWRGAAPIQRAIEAGDKETGVSIMQMDAGLDTGAILLQEICAIEAGMSSEQLHNKLANMGAASILKALSLLEQDNFHATVQSQDGISYAKKLSKEEAFIDWSQPAIAIARKIWAFNPWPVAQARLGDEIIRVWGAHIESPLSTLRGNRAGEIVHSDKTGIDVACGKGLLRLTQLQFPGGKVLSVKDLLNSKQAILQVGKQFT